VLRDLIKLANHLDQKGLTREADFLDKLVSLSGYTKKQVDTFDKDGDGVPFEKEDWEIMNSKADDVEGKIKCPNCGTMNDSDEENCVNCGYDLKKIKK
jgi:hypothetical protein